MLDILTVDAMRAAFLVALERYDEAKERGRTPEWSKLEAVGVVLARIGEGLEAHERRRSVRVCKGRDFPSEASVAWNGSIQLLRTGNTHEDAWAWFWKRLNAVVEPNDLF